MDNAQVEFFFERTNDNKCRHLLVTPTARDACHTAAARLLEHSNQIACASRSHEPTNLEPALI